MTYAQNTSGSDLSELKLDDLINLKVTSVSKKEQSLFKAGAAVFVITQEDIRQSGMTSVPDLLRMVPGVQVARITSNLWAISIRGFNNQYADKVLVLVDGRSVYDPSTSGVSWDLNDLPLEDIERIEIIRGPGGATWGANAMNGVIDIITKDSRSTQGGLLSVGGGSEQKVGSLLQYGGKAGNKGYYRVFGRYFDKDNSRFFDGTTSPDGWHGSHGGFRSDWDLTERDTLMVQGDLFQATEGQTKVPSLDRTPNLVPTITAASGDLLGKWNRTLQNGSEFSLQAYYSRRNPLDLYNQSVTDFESQYRFHLGSRQEVIANTEYRYNNWTPTNILPGTLSKWAPAGRSGSLFSASLEDEFAITGSLGLTLGSKFEHNPISGYEWEPAAQLTWTPTDRQTLWFSASRAIRQPSWVEAAMDLAVTNITLPNGVPAQIKIVGNPAIQAEQLKDFEMGYRIQFGRHWILDASTFLSYYRHMQTLDPVTPYFEMAPLPPHLVLPTASFNRSKHHTHGNEVFASWTVNSKWKISPGFTYLHMQEFAGDDYYNGVSDSPKFQTQVRSSYSLMRNLEWDTSVYRVGELIHFGIPAYTRVDTRFESRLGEGLTISVAGQNLLSPGHLEFNGQFGLLPTESLRSFQVQLLWKF